MKQLSDIESRGTDCLTQPTVESESSQTTKVGKSFNYRNHVRKSTALHLGSDVSCTNHDLRLRSERRDLVLGWRLTERNSHYLWTLCRTVTIELRVYVVTIPNLARFPKYTREYFNSSSYLDHRDLVVQACNSHYTSILDEPISESTRCTVSNAGW